MLTYSENANDCKKYNTHVVAFSSRYNYVMDTSLRLSAFYLCSEQQNTDQINHNRPNIIGAFVVRRGVKQFFS